LRHNGTATAVILDVEGTLARFDGDHQLFVEMTMFMLEDAPRHLLKLRESIEAEDAEAVEFSAHALKGLLLNCGGIRAASAAQALEDSGHKHELKTAFILLQALDAEVDALSSAIRKRAEQHQTSMK
jgi:HPt (histidine-containing phosphotransfer) domain-containing protein